jgi:two-component system CheB/CheR fusion protein
MNEELQSTNEELETINDELRERTGDLNRRQRLPRGDPDRRSGSARRCSTPTSASGLEPARGGPLGAAARTRAISQPFPSLDIGLPSEQLAPALRGRAQRLKASAKRATWTPSTP